MSKVGSAVCMGELLASLSFKEKKKISQEKTESLPLLAYFVVEGSVYGKVGAYSNDSCESLCVVK